MPQILPQNSRTSAQALEDAIDRIAQAPPPYMPPVHDVTIEEVCHDSGFEDEPPVPKLTVTVNGATTIHGSNNIVAMPPIDGPKIAAAIIAAFNSKAHSTGCRLGDVNVEINCGMSIIGDQNVISPAALRAAQAQSAATFRSIPARTPGTGAVDNFKRKLDNDSDGERQTKKVLRQQFAGPSNSP